MNIGEVYNAVRNRYSIPFELNDRNRKPYVQYSCKTYDVNICMSDKNEDCILVNYTNKKKLSGFGIPCDDIEKAYRHLDEVIPLRNYKQTTLF